MNYAFVLSIIFYICGVFYALFGAIIAAIFSTSKINRLFVFLTSAMAIWGITYSLANAAETAAASAFWRCVAVFGWGVFFSLLLHFVLILTKIENRFNKWALAAVLYLPAVINIILYAPFGLLAENQFEMVKVDFGWTNVLST